MLHRWNMETTHTWRTSSQAGTAAALPSGYSPTSALPTLCCHEQRATGQSRLHVRLINAGFFYAISCTKRYIARMLCYKALLGPEKEKDHILLGRVLPKGYGSQHFMPSPTLIEILRPQWTSVITDSQSVPIVAGRKGLGATSVDSWDTRGETAPNGIPWRHVTGK